MEKKETIDRGVADTSSSFASLKGAQQLAGAFTDKLKLIDATSGWQKLESNCLPS